MISNEKRIIYQAYKQLSLDILRSNTPLLEMFSSYFGALFNLTLSQLKENTNLHKIEITKPVLNSLKYLDIRSSYEQQQFLMKDKIREIETHLVGTDAWTANCLELYEELISIQEKHSLLKDVPVNLIEFKQQIQQSLSYIDTIRD